jgi:outer membrane protein assembly factor BamB
MGGYIGAVAHHEGIYINSGDRFLYALDTKSGRLRWRHQFAATGYYPATVADDVLYINVIADSAYALSSEDGAVLWRQPLVSNPDGSFTFSPSVVLGGAVYLVRSDKRGKGVLYALDRHTGAECWHWQTSPPSAIAPLAIAQ